MNVTCSAEPCPVILNATCVFYEGETLLYTGITTNDNLQTALQKIDAKFADASIGYAFNNGLIQSAPGQPVQLGGSLIQNTTIGGNYKLAFVGELEASALVTTGGTSSQFVKGDGTLDSTSYQPAGNYISSLVGDGTASGPGAATLTLATVFGAPGTYGNSTTVPRVTVDSKGRVTNVVNTLIALPSDALLFQGDVTGSGFTGSPVTLTLNTVNTDIYGSNNFLKFAVNGKGLITSATPVSNGDITTALGYVPVDDAIELTINGVSHDLSANRSWSVGTVTNVSITAGTGINASISNPNTIPSISITNTAPDQTVVLNGGTGISITGSYPNFTITNDYPSLGGTVTNFSAGNLSPLFTTSVSNSSTTPALSFALSNAAANTVFAGPNGGSGAPTFRALVAADIPSLSYISSISVSSPLASTGGLTPTLSISQADSSTNGYLSSVDWNTFNAKQPAGNYITALTGDATASGPGSACLTFNTVNATTGTFGSSTQVPVITVNGKGLVTCVTTSNISGSLEFIGDVTGTGSTGACTTLTLATVNNDVYASETLLNIAVNGKGLITSANPTTAGDICSTLGYTPENVANKSTCTSLGTSNTLYPTQLAVKTYVDSATAGGIILQGNWNAATNTPDITGTTTTGWAWRVDVAGTTNLGGITDWQVGDLAVKSATGWVKIDNTENVTSVFGRFGAIVATTGDYLSCQVTECGNLYYTDARVRAAVGHTSPLTYCSTTGVFGITQSSCGADGYLSATDWTTFNDKQPALGYTPVNQTRQLTINGTTYDLTADRSWSVGTVTSVTGSAPLASSGGTAPNLTISQSGTASDGYLSSTDWNHFNSHTSCTGTVTNVATCTSTTGVLLSGSPVTTSGTLGVDISTASSVCTGLLTAADWNTFNSHTGCTGTVTSVGLISATTGVTIGNSPITSSGDITLNIATASSLCTGLLTSSDWNTFNSHTGCTGTVTCVDAIGTNISVTGGPITSSGTLNISLSGANVCSALGYTPYDSSNPSGYTTCMGTVTSVGIVATNINVCCSPVTTSGNICLDLTAANVCAALGYSPSTAPTIFVDGIGTCSVLRCGVSNGASGDYTASLGGQSNLVSGCYSTIVGGQCNNISERRAVIVGGLCNTVSSYGGAVFTGVCNTSSGISASVVVGGSYNTASGYLSIVGGGNRNSATATYSSVFSGCCNTTCGCNSFIGGGYCNIVSGNYSSISSGFQNTASGTYSFVGSGQCNCATIEGAFVGGGATNTANSNHAFVGGGLANTASGIRSTVAGGRNNTASGDCSTIVGGEYNCASGCQSFAGGGGFNTASGYRSFIGGGGANTSACTNSAVVGGTTNNACANYAFVGGGFGNTANGSKTSVVGGNMNTNSGYYAFIGGGSSNYTGSYQSFIGAGYNNYIVSGNNSAIVGGINNTVSGYYSFIGGGNSNSISSGISRAVVVGGSCNTASGNCSTVGGGRTNQATNDDSVVAGGATNVASGTQSSIGGGFLNCAVASYSSIGGGYNSRTTGSFAAVSGGDNNTASGCRSFVGGGADNVASGIGSVLSGGCLNTTSAYGAVVSGGKCNIASATSSTISGGYLNTASGNCSAVLGGCGNTASGAFSGAFGFGVNNSVDCSFAANRLIATNLATAGCAVCTDANGMLVPYTASAGGPTLFVDGAGTCSAIRCGVNNAAIAAYSTALGGCSNSVVGACSGIFGGCCNVIQGGYSSIIGGQTNASLALNSFIGGGNCNAVYNFTNQCLAYGAVVVGGVGNNTTGGTFTLASCCFTVAPTICNAGAMSFIGGGFQNRACGACSAIQGGQNNSASGSYNSIGGGKSNTSSAFYSVVAGGACNIACGGNSFVGGGKKVCATQNSSTASGGYCNLAGGGWDTVGGGRRNCSTSPYATISGGYCNTASNSAASVGGGCLNTASGTNSAVLGGRGNTASASYSGVFGCALTNSVACSFMANRFVAANIPSGCAVCADANNMLVPYTAGGGGIIVAGSGFCSTVRCNVNNNACGQYSTVLGGCTNTASGNCSVIVGGQQNSASGSYSFVGGGKNNCASSIWTAIVGGCANCTPTGTTVTCFAPGYACINSGDSFNAGGFVCLNSNDFNCNFQCGLTYLFCWCNRPAPPAFQTSGCFSLIVTSAPQVCYNCFTFCCAQVFNLNTSPPFCIGVAGASCGGALNQQTFQGDGSFIGGGILNKAGGICSIIGSGICNTLTSTASCAGILTGNRNTVSGYASSIAGGSNNTVTANTSFIGGGSCSTISAPRQGFIGSGTRHTVSCSYGVVAGGFCNSVRGQAGAILGGCVNNVNHANSNIIGSNLTTGAICTTYTNALSKQSGTFRISHPDPSKTATKYLQHSFVESPTRGDNIYRFSACTLGCNASIQLPDYYKFLNENDQVWISPKNHFGSAYGVVDSCQSFVNITSNCDGEYNVLVIGTRKDVDAKNGWLGIEIWK